MHVTVCGCWLLTVMVCRLSSIFQRNIVIYVFNAIHCLWTTPNSRSTESIRIHTPFYGEDFCLYFVRYDMFTDDLPAHERRVMVLKDANPH